MSRHETRTEIMILGKRFSLNNREKELLLLNLNKLKKINRKEKIRRKKLDKAGFDSEGLRKVGTTLEQSGLLDDVESVTAKRKEFETIVKDLAKKYGLFERREAEPKDQEEFSQAKVSYILKRLAVGHWSSPFSKEELNRLDGVEQQLKAAKPFIRVFENSVEGSNSSLDVDSRASTPSSRDSNRSDRSVSPVLPVSNHASTRVSPISPLETKEHHAKWKEQDREHSPAADKKRGRDIHQDASHRVLPSREERDRARMERDKKGGKEKVADHQHKAQPHRPTSKKP